MPLLDLSSFQKVIPPEGRLLGLDVGTKTIGIALSDFLRLTASPLHTIPRMPWPTVKETLQKDISEHSIKGIVIGLPLNMDGSRGPRAQSIQQFAKNLEGILDIPLTFWDERLSTVAVERAMVEADLSRKKRQKLVDKLAAAYILEGALLYLQK